MTWGPNLNQKTFEHSQNKNIQFVCIFNLRTNLVVLLSKLNIKVFHFSCISQIFTCSVQYFRVLVESSLTIRSQVATIF